MTYRVIRVTLTEDYLVSDDILDGRTIEEVTKDWFLDHGVNRYHAARDSSLVGNSRVVLSYGPADGPPVPRVVPSEGQRVSYQADAEALPLEATFVREVEGWYQLCFADGSMGIVRPSKVAL